jgi:hypothetical protein
MPSCSVVGCFSLFFHRVFLFVVLCLLELGLLVCSAFLFLFFDGFLQIFKSSLRPLSGLQAYGVTAETVGKTAMPSFSVFS